jgi:hypothetical protein
LNIADTKDFKANKLVKTELLNLDGAKVLQKIIVGKTTISNDKDHLIFETGNRQLISRKSSGQFPNYTMVIPKDKPFTFDIHAAEIKPVVENALSFANGAQSIAFQPYYNHFVVKSGDSEKEFSATASCNFPQNTAKAVSLNGKYFLDIFNACDQETLKVNFKDNKAQFEIVGSNDLTNYTFIIMPLKENGDFEIISDEQKAELKLQPFYKSFTPETAKTAKPKKECVIAELKDILAEIKAIATIKGLPEMFKEITFDAIDRADNQLALL